jgi:hypothetical protein
VNLVPVLPQGYCHKQPSNIGCWMTAFNLSRSSFFGISELRGSRGSTEHMVRPVKTDPAHSSGLRSKKNFQPQGRFLS